MQGSGFLRLLIHLIYHHPPEEGPPFGSLLSRDGFFLIPGSALHWEC